MSILKRSAVPFVPASGSGGGEPIYSLINPLEEQYIGFSNTTGHNHDGANSMRINHSDLADIVGTKTHSAIDLHINKSFAVPQTEKSAGLVNVSYYQIRDGDPAFVGRPGNTAASVMSLLSNSVILGSSGNPITVVDITSDQAGTVSVIGSGYVARPYVQFSEAIPNLQIRVRYGVQMTLDTLPESVLINEPLWVGETDQDVRDYILEIKGGEFDRVITPSENLQGLDTRLSAAQLSIAGITPRLSTAEANIAHLHASIGTRVSKQFGFAPEFPNMVFDNSGIANSNGSWLGGFEDAGSLFHTYLGWSTNLNSPQSYRIKLAVKLPSDFDHFDGVHPLQIWRKSDGVLANVAMNVTLHDIANSVSSMNMVNLANSTPNSWECFSATPITSGNFIANGWCCLTIEVTASGVGNVIKIGRLDFKYTAV